MEKLHTMWVRNKEGVVSVGLARCGLVDEILTVLAYSVRMRLFIYMGEKFELLE